MKNMSDVVVEESYRADICFQALVLAIWDVCSENKPLEIG
jgi:hypothetical protein